MTVDGNTVLGLMRYMLSRLFCNSFISTLTWFCPIYPSMVFHQSLIK